MMQPSNKRAQIGKLLVGFAVLAPSLLVLTVYLVLQGRLYGYHFPGSLWPWIAGDLAVLAVGIVLMRGQDV